MRKKLVTAIVALTLALSCLVGVTMAWLSVETGPVTNTFTYGDINIELKEHKYVNGALTTEEVTANDTYKVIPGGEEDKDPFVRVKKGSEKCYVYVTIENTVKIDNEFVASVDVDTSKWEVVATNGNTTLYRYSTVVDATSADQVLQVFTKVSYDGELILKTNIAQVENTKITVKAYAYQEANVSEADADAAVKELAKMN